jgi:hypothetical protein
MVGYAPAGMTSAFAMPAQSDFHPLSAGAYLLTVVLICIGIGAGIGVAAGSAGIGAAVGALVGVPAGVGAVILRYRGRV